MTYPVKPQPMDRCLETFTFEVGIRPPSGISGIRLVTRSQRPLQSSCTQILKYLPKWTKKYLTIFFNLSHGCLNHLNFTIQTWISPFIALIFVICLYYNYSYLICLTQDGSHAPGISCLHSFHWPYLEISSADNFSGSVCGRNAALTRLENKLIISVTISYKTIFLLCHTDILIKIIKQTV